MTPQAVPLIPAINSRTHANARGRLPLVHPYFPSFIVLVYIISQSIVPILIYVILSIFDKEWRKSGCYCRHKSATSMIFLCCTILTQWLQNYMLHIFICQWPPIYGPETLRSVMKLIHLFFLLPLITAFTIHFGGDVPNNYGAIQEYLSKHHPIEIDTINDLDARDLFKAGVAKVKKSKTLIIPDGDYIDIVSFDDINVHIGQTYYFAEYDFSKVKYEDEKVVQTLGTGLDNSRSTVDNLIEFTLGISNSITDTMVHSILLQYAVVFTHDYEIDETKGTAVSESVSCNVGAGKVGIIESVSQIKKLTNIKKRIVAVKITKSLAECLKGAIKLSMKECLRHTYNYELGKWETTEIEAVRRVSAYCKDAD